MRILTDPKEYIDLQAWAQKTVESMGIGGAHKLKTSIDKAIQEGAVKLDIEKLDGMSFSLFNAINEKRLKVFMTPGIEAIKKVKKNSQAQSQKRAKREHWNGQSHDQLSKRNQKMIEHFKRTHLSRSGFAKKHAAKYGLKPRRVMDILKMAVCTLPG
jgi:hypothetical protein